jgi:cytochrome c oxidase subunit 2
MGTRAVWIAVASTILAIAVAAGWARQAAADRPGIRTFDVTGIGAIGRWTLDAVNGVNYAWKDFEPATMFVETGDEVVIHLRSADVFHQFYLPEFSVGPVDVEPGHTATVRFHASHGGVFQFYCTSMCGACHFYMRGWIVVTDPGETPIVPPPVPPGICSARVVEIPPGTGLVATGALLYEGKGCVTCHGPRGRGGIPNDNSTSRTVPAHDTTAQKLLLLSREDAGAFVSLLEATGDLEAVEDPGIAAFAAVRARFLNAKEIVRMGRFTAKANPDGPQPPLQMLAWKYLLEEREIDALLAYFVSLYDWGEEELPDPGPASR